METIEKKILLRTTKLINMIPILMKYVLGYSIENEVDLKYRDIVSDEFKWISENQSKITKRARQIYFFKANEDKTKYANNAKVYESVLPFKDIEQFILDLKLMK